MHKPKPLRANLSKELRELIMHMLAKKPKNRPTAREIADMLYCEIAVRPPMQRSLQPRVHGIGGAALARRVQLKTVDSTICAQLDTQVRAHSSLARGDVHSGSTWFSVCVFVRSRRR